MHPNAQLIERLYSGLNRHAPEAMAVCYHPEATFHDIAFHLRDRNEIAAMWEMICSGDISTTFEIARADDREVVAKLVDEYTFSDTGRRVRNAIESRFRFRDGLIIEHSDVCDARSWAAAAIGGIPGFFAGRLRFLRAWKARAKLKRFQREKLRAAAHDTL